MINVTLIPVLNDNYAYVLESDNGDVGVVDPGEAAPVIEYLESKGLKPNVIFATHHHGDHIAGIPQMLEWHRCKVAGPSKEMGRIENMDILLDEFSAETFGGEPYDVLETPGHTKGHISIHFPESKLLFVGDTLFVMGCGRLFEGTPEQMWESFEKITALPDDTQIYCGHEYTLSNAEFCLKVEPENDNLKTRYEDVKTLREQNKPTIPTTLGEEKKTNVFLRAGNAEKFGEYRLIKDRG